MASLLTRLAASLGATSLLLTVACVFGGQPLPNAPVLMEPQDGIALGPNQSPAIADLTQTFSITTDGNPPSLRIRPADDASNDLGTGTFADDGTLIFDTFDSFAEHGFEFFWTAYYDLGGVEVAAPERRLRVDYSPPSANEVRVVSASGDEIYEYPSATEAEVFHLEFGEPMSTSGDGATLAMPGLTITLESDSMATPAMSIVDEAKGVYAFQFATVQPSDEVSVTLAEGIQDKAGNAMAFDAGTVSRELRFVYNAEGNVAPDPDTDPYEGCTDAGFDFAIRLADPAGLPASMPIDGRVDMPLSAGIHSDSPVDATSAPSDGVLVQAFSTSPTFDPAALVLDANVSGPVPPSFFEQFPACSFPGDVGDNCVVPSDFTGLTEGSYYFVVAFLQAPDFPDLSTAIPYPDARPENNVSISSSPVELTAAGGGDEDWSLTLVSGPPAPPATIPASERLELAFEASLSGITQDPFWSIDVQLSSDASTIASTDISMRSGEPMLGGNLLDPIPSCSGASGLSGTIVIPDIEFSNNPVAPNTYYIHVELISASDIDTSNNKQVIEVIVESAVSDLAIENLSVTPNATFNWSASGGAAQLGFEVTNLGPDPSFSFSLELILQDSPTLNPPFNDTFSACVFDADRMEYVFGDQQFEGLASGESLVLTYDIDGVNLFITDPPDLTQPFYLGAALSSPPGEMDNSNNAALSTNTIQGMPQADLQLNITNSSMPNTANTVGSLTYTIENVGSVPIDINTFPCGFITFRIQVLISSVFTNLVEYQYTELSISVQDVDGQGTPFVLGPGSSTAAETVTFDVQPYVDSGDFVVGVTDVSFRGRLNISHRIPESNYVNNTVVLPEFTWN